MNAANASNEPNEFGFAGAATTPQPTPDDPADELDEGSVAVPADDLTGAISGAITDATTPEPQDAATQTPQPSRCGLFTSSRYRMTAALTGRGFPLTEAFVAIAGPGHPPTLISVPAVCGRESPHNGYSCSSKTIQLRTSIRHFRAANPSSSAPIDLGTCSKLS